MYLFWNCNAEKRNHSDIQLFIWTNPNWLNNTTQNLFRWGFSLENFIKCKNRISARFNKVHHFLLDNYWTNEIRYSCLDQVQSFSLQKYWVMDSSKFLLILLFDGNALKSRNKPPTTSYFPIIYWTQITHAFFSRPRLWPCCNKHQQGNIL